jgi:hypothetical protein
MSFNRLKYDSCQLKKQNDESSGPGMYMIETPIIPDKVFNDNPRVVNQKLGASIPKDVDWRFYNGPVDIESKLWNLEEPSSKCTSYQSPSYMRSETVEPEVIHFPSLDTRLSIPMLKEASCNRFESLCMNPQEHIFFPLDHTVSTRIVFKDNHRPMIPKPKINDMNPYEEMMNQAPIQNVSGNFTGALYQYDVCG